MPEFVRLPADWAGQIGITLRPALAGGAQAVIAAEAIVKLIRSWRTTASDSAQLDSMASGIAEARTNRIWRDRCGEPLQQRAPIRCRRDLSHPTPHVGPLGDDPVIWPGAGNLTSAQRTDHKCFDSMRLLPVSETNPAPPPTYEDLELAVVRLLEKYGGPVTWTPKELMADPPRAYEWVSDVDGRLTLRLSEVPAEQGDRDG